MRISTNTKKSLENQIGQRPAKEIFDILSGLIQEVETLKRNKVDVTKIIKGVDDNV
tara:strand:+ start:812 stop:979 length:168 start_codon:yes stop_codon:yes gene_type:complete